MSRHQPRLTYEGFANAAPATHAALRALGKDVDNGTINQWNRIAVALRFAPPLPPTGKTA